MQEKNIFIVTSPLQLMNSIEAIEHFKIKNNILLILYISDRTLFQIKKLLKFTDWEKVQYILLPQGIKDKFFFTKTVKNHLGKLKNQLIAKIFVGDYESDHLNHIVNWFECEDVYLVDDGLAVSFYEIRNLKETFKTKIKRLVYKSLGYKLNKIKYTFFTIFDIKNEKVIKNHYTYFKKYLGSKKVEDTVYFIGQPIVELGVMSRADYKKELLKVINFYKNFRFLYIVHRRENIENIKQLSIDLDFDFKEFDNLIELEMINSTVVPSNFATFSSTAIVTLPNFISEAEYRVFRSKDKLIHKKFIGNISTVYRNLKEMGLRVELL